VSGGDYRVEVHGSVGGNLVVGDHNLIVNAQTGSSVTVVQEADRPKPVRRPSVRLLPRRPSEFVGRAAELGAIAGSVVAQSTIQVYGPSGVGKSTLLRQSAYSLAGETSGVAYLTAAGRDGDDLLQEIFEACYETSGYRPSNTELRRFMSGVRATLFVDDLVVGDDALAAILDTVPDTGFVFTSVARELWGQGQVLALTGLPEDQALALFRHEFGRDLTAAELAAASRSWRESNGSPIAILRAAAALAATPPTQTPVIPAQRDSEDPERTVPSTVPLTPPQRDVFDLLRALPQGPISIPVLTRLAGAPDPAKVEAAADRLDQVGLAERVDDTFQLVEDLATERSPYRRDAATMAEAMVAWLGSADVTPREVAVHAGIIIGLVDEAVAEGHAEAGCRLARTAAAFLALSLGRVARPAGQRPGRRHCEQRQGSAGVLHPRAWHPDAVPGPGGRGRCRARVGGGYVARARACTICAARVECAGPGECRRGRSVGFCGFRGGCRFRAPCRFRTARPAGWQCSGPAATTSGPPVHRARFGPAARAGLSSAPSRSDRNPGADPRGRRDHSRHAPSRCSPRNVRCHVAVDRANPERATVTRAAGRVLRLLPAPL
jgi:hypothetical protein